MTVTNKTLVTSQYVPDVATALYTAGDAVAVIGTFVVANSSGDEANVTLYIVEPDQSVGGSNKLSDSHRVRPNEEWRAVGMEGQVLQQGATIYAESSVSNALTIRVSGVEIT